MDGEILGLAHNLTDVAEFLRRAGLEIDAAEVAQSPWIEWKGAGLSGGGRRAESGDRSPSRDQASGRQDRVQHGFEVLAEAGAVTPVLRNAAIGTCEWVYRLSKR